MSSPLHAITPAGFRLAPHSAGFTSTNGTAAKVIVEPLPNIAAGANTPLYYGGGTVLDLVACNSDTSARNVALYSGTVATTQETAATGTITLTAQNTLTRATVTANGWIGEGWQVGDLAMVFAAPGTTQAAANIDGLLGIVTGVTTAALTVAGTPWAAGTTALAAGSRVVRIKPRAVIALPAGSGLSPTVPSVSLMGSSSDGSSLRQEIKLGTSNVLIASLQSAVSSTAYFVSIDATLALY